jgi:hypothetical protein
LQLDLLEENLTIDEAIIELVSSNGSAIDGITTRICPQMFDFNYNVAHTQLSAGISSLVVSVDIGGGVTKTYQFGNLYFNSGPLNGCPGTSLATIAANAINQGIQSASIRIVSGDLVPLINTVVINQNPDLNAQMKVTLLYEITKKFDEAINLCAPDYSGISTGCKLMSSGNKSIEQLIEGTIFTDFPTQFTSRCL